MINAHVNYTFVYCFVCLKDISHHMWIFAMGPGTNDPYITSIEKVLGQQTNLRHDGITEFSNIAL